MNKPCNKCEYGFEFNGKKFQSFNDKCYNCEKHKKYLQYRESKRKYKSTNVKVKSIDDLLNNDWFIWNGCTKHKTFFLNQQLNTILKWISSGNIFIAKLKDKEGD